MSLSWLLIYLYILEFIIFIIYTSVFYDFYTRSMKDTVASY